MTAKWMIAPSHEELAFLVEAGVIYREAGNFDAARDIFNGVKSLYPTHDFPEVFLGTVEFQQKHFDAAEVHYRKAIELNPRSAFAYAHLGEAFLFRKDKENARTHLKTALTLDPLGDFGKLARRLLEMADRVTFV
ncbi:MAG TPA: tetratricopeptide repeat protein [Candidatus Sulfotelmatobacter sp.]|jgi:tetratricopeptide (TPR) repeat protein|nr:tetratricopeptide repeat protein [Candidatus Sulfotelmatobacter sp.]